MNSSVHNFNCHARLNCLIDNNMYLFRKKSYCIKKIDVILTDFTSASSKLHLADTRVGGIPCCRVSFNNTVSTILTVGVAFLSTFILYNWNSIQKPGIC